MRTKGIGPQGLGLKGNNGYSIGSPAKFKTHNMYSKSGKAVKANTKQEHLDLKKKGYGHTPSPTKLKDACYRKVKAQYDVFPSAYASGAIAKCRKKNK